MKTPTQSGKAAEHRQQQLIWLLLLKVDNNRASDGFMKAWSVWLCVSRNVFKATSLSLSRRVEKQCTRNSPLRVWIPIKTVLAYNVLPGSSTLKGHILLGNFSILKLFSLLGSIIPWLFNFKVPAFKSNRITDFISNFNIQSNMILVCLGIFLIQPLKQFRKLMGLSMALVADSKLRICISGKNLAT